MTISQFEDSMNTEFHQVTSTKLVSHLEGHIKSGLIFEDKNGKIVYKLMMTKFRLFGPDEYELSDMSTGYTKTLKIGKTISTSIDGINDGETITTSSRFKIDGINCWDYLRQKGYTITHSTFGSHLSSYALISGDRTIAQIIAVSVRDPWNEEKQSLLGMQPGSYRIEIRDGSLEDAIMATFIVFKTGVTA